MPYFTLTCVDEDGTESKKEFQSAYLTDVVEKTEDFLRGVGFFFDELKVSNESHYGDEQLEDTTPELITDTKITPLESDEYDPPNPEIEQEIVKFEGTD